MPKCIKPSCNRGCCGHDHSSKAEQAPSIVDIEVVRKILSHAIVNMCKRAIACAEGELTRDELAEKDMKLMEWLGETFCGNTVILNRALKTGQPKVWQNTSNRLSPR